MSPSEKPLKIPPWKPRFCKQPSKNMLKKRTQASILSQSEKKVRMRNTVTNAGNLEVDGLEVVQHLITALWIRLNEFQHPLQMLKTDLGIGSGIKLTHKLAKSMTEKNSKVYELKTYNKTIDNLIHGNKQRKAINKKLWNQDFYQT